jgi:two-component system alkaline phosphatase synthesis response regulator PhoP
MLKILLISQNKNNIKLITKLSEEYFEIQQLEDLEKFTNYLENAKLLILDICEQDIEKDSYYSELFKKINQTDILKLLVLAEKQAKNVLNFRIKVDDLLFSTQINNELISRINFILYNLKIIIPKNSIVVGELILNLDKYELTINGLTIELTFKEYELLKILLENQNRVFSRNKLLSIIWGYNFYGGSRTVDVHMRRLRSKMLNPYDQMLKTVRNVGYMFSPKI